MPPSTPRSERTVLLDDLTVDVGPALSAEQPPPGATSEAAPGPSGKPPSSAGSGDPASGDPASGGPASGDPASGVPRSESSPGATDAATSTSSPHQTQQTAEAPGDEPSDEPAATSRRQRRREQRAQRRAERAQRRGGDADSPMPGATQVVEAATAEQAISQVHQQLGAHAQILDAKLVRRGGFGGFFAREIVQLHVAPGTSDAGSQGAGSPAADGPAPASEGVDLADTGNVRRHWITGTDDAAPSSGAGSSSGRATAGGGDTRSPVDRLLASDELLDADADAGDFATFLRRHLGAELDEAPGAPAGSAHGSANGSMNGTANGSVNGSTNGAANGSVNGSAHGTANGSTNGSVNGAATAEPAADHQGPRTWAEYLQTRQGPVGAPVAWPQIDTEGCEVLRPLPADAPSDTPSDSGATSETVKSALPMVDAEGEPATTGPAPALDPREDAGDRTVDLHEHSPDGAAPAAQRRGGSLGSVAAAAPLASATAPCVDEGGVSWSAVGLVRLGLPRTFVDTVEVDDPYDDLAWTAALTGALRELCGPLPDRPSVMVGPLAPTVAEGAGVPTASSQLWLRSLRAQRWVHVVVGGDGWRDWLDEEPLAVSWARPEDLPEAIRCAAELGLRLGFGPLGGAVRRAHPMDVALAVRELVDER